MEPRRSLYQSQQHRGRTRRIGQKIAEFLGHGAARLGQQPLQRIGRLSDMRESFLDQSAQRPVSP